MKNFDTVEFIADSVKVNGPRVDGSYSITFSTGEYGQQMVAKILTIPQQTPIQIKIDYDKG